ncbi:hypothetical protein RB195_015315 [Necator americanus]|uniref:Uncharacterized protein n=1 Tax=Necator americanus TaxID=51031 RepID=A0ABR1E433_NECAM
MVLLSNVVVFLLAMKLRTIRKEKKKRRKMKRKMVGREQAPSERSTSVRQTSSEEKPVRMHTASELVVKAARKLPTMTLDEKKAVKNRVKNLLQLRDTKKRETTKSQESFESQSSSATHAKGFVAPNLLRKQETMFGRLFHSWNA